jgi:hypothetical protein
VGGEPAGALSVGAQDPTQIVRVAIGDPPLPVEPHPPLWFRALARDVVDVGLPPLGRAQRGVVVTADALTATADDLVAAARARSAPYLWSMLLGVVLLAARRRLRPIP